MTTEKAILADGCFSAYNELPPARVISLPVDLLRHELLMTLEPAAAETIASIVDDVFLPLARVSSGL